MSVPASHEIRSLDHLEKTHKQKSNASNEAHMLSKMENDAFRTAAIVFATMLSTDMSSCLVESSETCDRRLRL